MVKINHFYIAKQHACGVEINQFQAQLSIPGIISILIASVT